MLIKISAKSKNSFRVTTPSAFVSNDSKFTSAALESAPTDAMKSWQMSAWSSSKVRPPSPLSLLQIAKPETIKRHHWYFWEKHEFSYLLNESSTPVMGSPSVSCLPQIWVPVGYLLHTVPLPKTSWNDKPRRTNNIKVDFMVELKSKVTFWSQFLALFIPKKQVFEKC